MDLWFSCMWACLIRTKVTGLSHGSSRGELSWVRSQSNLTANQGVFFCPGRGTTVLMKTVIRASFPFMTNSCASSKCAKHKSDQLSHYPQLFVINYQPPRLNDEAHPVVSQDTVLLRTRYQLQEDCTEINKNPTFIKGLTLLQKLRFQRLIWRLLL